MSLRISPVSTRKEIRRFIDFPYSVYENDPNWVPPLRIEMKSFLSRKHPFLLHAEIQFFLALSEGEVVGRIAAIENRAHNDFHKDRVGFFGFFESIDSVDVARALIEAAGDWVINRGLTQLRGPMNLSTNESCGLFLAGEKGPPVFMMPHNPPYYPKLLEAVGLTKAKDLLALYQNDKNIPERLERSSSLLKKRHGVVVRNVALSKYNSEVDRIFELYNQCWEDNWGFVPMVREEVMLLAKDLRMFIDPDLVLFLEREEDLKPIGFALAVPDLNIPIKKTKGRLFPTGWLTMLLHRKKIRRMRLMALAIAEEYRGKGLDSLMLLDLYKGAVSKGYQEAEISWVLEDNLPVLNAVERIGGKLYRTYRIYEKAL